MLSKKRSGWRGAGFALLIVALCGSFSSAQPDTPRGEVRVMTQNLYIGALLDPVIEADNPIALLFAVDTAWQAVQDTDFPERAKSIADQIAREKPDLVGLQEVALWRIQSPGDILSGGSVPATEVAYDFLATLLGELEARGQFYDVAVSLEGMDAELPSITGYDIRFTDRDVTLVRRVHNGNGPVKLLSTDAGYFDTLLTVPVVGGTIALKRGWSVADVKVRGRTMRFVNTHLESVHPLVRQAQAYELATGPLATSLPVICLGDFNTDAAGDGSDGYNILLGAGLGLEDAWTDVYPSAAGLTWGHDPDLLNATPTFTERLDLILYRGPFRVLEIDVIGDRQADRTESGLWPADHAGVVAVLR
jgi:endonuclease/exonuclease/phosphatase family metal-dependent hydrolase